MRSAAVVMREWKVPTYIVGKNLIDLLDPVATKTKTRQRAELTKPALIVTVKSESSVPTPRTTWLLHLLHLTVDPRFITVPPRTRYHLASALSCPVICNPGAPTAHLFMLHFFSHLFLLAGLDHAAYSLQVHTPAPWLTNYGPLQSFYFPTGVWIISLRFYESPHFF